MKIVGQLVCGPGEADRWLDLTLKEFARLCDDVIVCLCNAGPKEKALVQSYDFRSYEDTREWGRDQPNIKTDLLRRILKLTPDYILALDADETLPTVRSRDELKRIAGSREACQFYVANLINDELHYSRSMSFWNVRAYRADESKGVQFLRKPVHCGNAPPYFYTIPPKKSYVPHILLHRGLMLPSDRSRKSTRYQQYDPNAIHKGVQYYDALRSTELTGSVYNEENVLKHIQEYVSGIQHHKKP